jgi:hypothetical protein
VIRLTRERSPEAIHRNFQAARRRELELELLRRQRDIRRKIETEHKWRSDIWRVAKDQLLFETGGKCAYCEAPTSHVAYGDVEHYRPKSIYWWLAYCYDNYLASCTLCNQKYKSAGFPIKNGMLDAPKIRLNTTDAYIETRADTIAPDPLDACGFERFLELHRQERPLLLNPYYDDPELYFAWRADNVLAEVELVPVPDDPDAALFCAAAVKYYGLNRKELLSLRWGVYSTYWLFRAFVEDGTLSDELLARTRSMIETMKDGHSAYAGMIRYFDKFPFDALVAPRL